MEAVDPLALQCLEELRWNNTRAGSATAAAVDEDAFTAAEDAADTASAVTAAAVDDEDAAFTAAVAAPSVERA